MKKYKLSDQILSLSINPNLIGEILREKFFHQNREKGLLGCYSTFELNPNVIKLPDEINFDYGDENGVKVAVCQLDDIIMKYFWDGDGNLTFYFPDGTIINNDDCKKDYNWEKYN